MIQIAFANKATEILKTDKSVIGLAVAGSWQLDTEKSVMAYFEKIRQPEK